jgi:hypothetical protein
MPAKIVIEAVSKDQAILDLIAKVKQLEDALKKAKGEAKANKAALQGMDVSLADMAKNAASFAAGMIGVNSASAIAGKIIAAAKEDFAQLVAMQAQAAAVQTGLSDTVGELLVNSAETAKPELKKLFDFARQEAAAGRGTTESNLAAALEVQNAAPMATMQEQMDGLRLGLQANQLSARMNVGQFAVGAIKTRAELEKERPGTSMDQASNLMLAMAARSGGSFATMVNMLPKLTALAGRASNTDLPDVYALQGFLSQRLGDTTGEGTLTTVANLLSRVSTRQIEIEGKVLDFKGAGGLDRLVELGKGIESGAFGDPTVAISALAKLLGRESAEIKIAMSAIAKDAPQLAEARGTIRAALAKPTSTLAELAQSKAELFPASRSVQATRAASNQANAAQGASDVTAEWGQVRGRIESFVKKYQITTGFDWTASFRDWAANQRGETPAAFEKREQERLLAAELTSRTPGAGRISGAVGAWDVAGRGGSGAFARGQMEGPLPYAGMDEVTMLREFAQRGVSPAGGFTGPEIPALQSVGIDMDTITAWNDMFKRGLVDDLQKAFTAAFRDAFAQPTPAANALNP